MFPYVAGLAVSWTTAALSFWLNPKTVLWVSYGIVNPLLFSIPRLVRLMSSRARARVSNIWLTHVEILGALIILTNAPGSLILHDLGIQYDRFLHLSAGFLIVLLAVPILGALFTDIPKRDERKKLLRIVCAVVFMSLLLFEGYQWTVDHLFGTELFHDAVQPIERDVMEDIIFGTLGIALAACTARVPKVWAWLIRGIVPPPSAN